MERDAAYVLAFTIACVTLLGLFGRLDSAQLTNLLTVSFGLITGGAGGYALGRRSRSQADDDQGGKPPAA